MKLVLIADEQQVLELGDDLNTNSSVVILRDASQIPEADGVLDLLFENTTERKKLLRNSSAKVIIVNSVLDSLSEIEPSFIRIAGWNTMLKRDLIEAAAVDKEKAPVVEKLFSLINKRVEWVSDIPGFISCRVIAQIINEAYYALQENVSSKDQIDIAMKLGTNYPYGPFEWAQKIGLKNIISLLEKLSRIESRYKPCTSILEEERS